MANVYISFLGTNNYLPCTYFRDGEEFQNARFVQEATVQLSCSEWTTDDRIVILTTNEAHQKNWLDDGHRDKNGAPIECAGLRQCLIRLNLMPKLKEVHVPSGESEQQLWEIFQILYDQLGEGDHVIFDITHAFRSIPMIALVVLHYAKVLKNLELSKIYYGAFESLGSFQEVSGMLPEKRRAPLFDLTPLYSLMDWSLAVDRFLGAGDASPACELAGATTQPMLRAAEGRDEAASAINRVAGSLNAFSKVMATCRGCEISKTAGRLKDDIDRCVHVGLLPPFRPLLAHIGSSLTSFTGNDAIVDGVCAARWCLDHNLIQQGYTILREVLVSYVADCARADLKDRRQRELAPQAASLFRKNMPEDEWTGDASRDPALTHRYVNVYERQPALVDLFSQLVELRNDLDHAGFRKAPKRAAEFGTKLAKLIAMAEEVTKR
ncbi:MAG: TIGR02221 family CRISPR-associated protein [Deltaproteobacteria bacterium]|jgi:CRISPR-associated Csx2 family protein|nr:TIGR02221 family CRISPR-associated protein [Deltaproteobacteria bacterium]